VWERRRGRELAALGRESCDDAPAADAPGSCTRVGDRRFHVHGITHADTDAEREFLRECVAAWLADGASVYCEQGIRPLYLADTDACAMDDYRWAMDRCRDAEVESHVADLLDDESNDATSGTSETEEADTTDATTATDAASAIGETNATGADPEPTGTGTERPDWTDHADGPDAGHTEPFVTPSPDELSARFRDVALSLLESDVEDGAGGALRRSLRDVVSAFPPSHEDMATGRDTEAVRLRRAAAQDPAQLSRLQRYYERAFLPQALEREWLARHDPELEIVTHARNARMADYAVAHADTPEVHLLVGAAHGPGVREYLERHRDGRRSLDGFTPM
ncbi:MAG: hypothetical protein ABEI75_04320, partial [Halobaculum sp.]